MAMLLDTSKTKNGAPNRDEGFDEMFSTTRTQDQGFTKNNNSHRESISPALSRLDIKVFYCY